MYTFAVDIASQTDLVAIIDPDGQLHVIGNGNGRYQFASVTKLITTNVIAEIVADGFVSFEEEVEDIYFSKGKVTLQDLLSHSSGIRPEYESCVPPRSKRVYTTEAFDIAEKHIIKKLGNGFENETIASIFSDGLKDELGCSITIEGSCGSGASGTADDLILLLREIREPKFISVEMQRFLTTPYFPELDGVLPGWGHFERNIWGVGYEIKGDKYPHWMGSKASKNSFGHFGLSGAFVMHDPENKISIASLSNENFGPWAKIAWPEMCDQIYSEYL